MAEKTPRGGGPKPPYPEQQQEHPGREGAMSPAPDYGEKSYKGHDRLKGKVALVTGADSGIGRAVALAFAREGADVVASYLSEHEDAEVTRRAVEQSGRQALLVPGDIAEAAHCRKLVGTAVERFGKIDILVNNAGYQGEEVKQVEELSPERIERAFRVNIFSMFFLSLEAARHLPQGGAIVNSASIQAYEPSPSILDYAATKGAIVTFTKGLSRALIARDIRVNAVAPGPVWTPLIPQSFEPGHVAKHGTKSPTGRSAQPARGGPGVRLPRLRRGAVRQRRSPRRDRWDAAALKERAATAAASCPRRLRPRSSKCSPAG